MLAVCLAVVGAAAERDGQPTKKRKQELNQRFEELYRREQDGLLRYANGRLHNPVLAEDIVADTFLQLARVFPKYADLEGEELHRLLVTMARNRMYDYFRKEKREQAWLEAEPCFVERGGGSSRQESMLLREEAIRRYEEKGGIEQYGIRKEMLLRLLEHLQELKEESRQVFLMRHYAGLPQREIARLLGIPVKTVEQRLYRAAKKLREEMERDGYEARDLTF